MTTVWGFFSWNSNLLYSTCSKCCEMCIMMTEKNVTELFSYSADREYGTLHLNIFYCKCLQMMVRFQLKMSTCVGPVNAADVCLHWFCYYCKCLPALVLLYYCKCLNVSVLFTFVSKRELNILVFQNYNMSKSAK